MKIRKLPHVHTLLYIIRCTEWIYPVRYHFKMELIRSKTNTPTHLTKGEDRDRFAMKEKIR